MMMLYYANIIQYSLFLLFDFMASISVYAQRMKEIRSYMRDHHLDAVVISSLSHIRYCTQFSGSSALILVERDHVHFLTDGRYTEQVKHELAPIRGLKKHITRQPWTLLAELGVLANIHTVGFQAHHTSVAAKQAVQKILRKNNIKQTWKPVGMLLEKICQVKSPQETALMQSAATIACTVYEYILGWIRPGMTEQDIATEIAYQTRKHGSEADAFDIIVASGERGALPHGRATHKSIHKGDMITLDFGCRIRGFHSDMTRTFALGKPSDEMRKIYEVVLSAQERAVASAHKAIDQSMTGRDLDRVARSCIEHAGYGPYFNHNTGHGLGLDVHEPPAIAESGTARLCAGSVITIEPGIYVPKLGGVRIEDDVLLHKNGCEILTHSPKGLIIV